MLTQNKPHIARVMTNEGYVAEELLDATRVRAYEAKKEQEGIVFIPAPVSPESGIAISTLDSVIDKMNQIQDEIIWGAE